MGDLITKKAIEWNALRYDRIFDYELATKLLLEETMELYEATSVVDKLDAIGDITFVAIGILWKLGFKEDEIHHIFYAHNMAAMTFEDAHHWLMTIQSHSMDSIDHTVPGAWPGVVAALYAVFNTALGAIIGMGQQNIYYDVCHAICDSNNTKSVQGKSAPNVKANVTKGLQYKPPTAKLLELYNVSLQVKKVVH